MKSGASRLRVVVTDGDERAALAATRSLVAAGHEVMVAGPRRRTLAGVTRGAQAVTLRAHPLLAAADYATEIGALATTFGADVLLPITDPSVEALLEHRTLLPPGVALPFPCLASYHAASDKIRMLACAKAAGLAVPASELVASPDDIERTVAAARYPVVLKPHRSVASGADGVRHKLGVTFAADATQLREALRTLPACAFPVLVQQRIRGPGEGIFALRWNGRILATFAHRRLREKPPAGGISVYRESIPLDPALERAAHCILEVLDWRGVAMIECKRDLVTGRHVFMEVNGRLWGSLQLAIDAGMDFPSLLVACATGAPISNVAPHRPGVRSRWFWGDVDHLYMRFTKSAEALHLEDDAPSRLAVLQDFFRVHRGQDRSEIWRWRDPAPGMLETLRRLLPGH